MKRLALALLLVAGCHRAAAPPRPHDEVTTMQTIESVPPRPAVIDPPPMLTDEAPPPKPKDPVAAQNMVPLSDEDDRVRAGLPFAPAIAMDPVDGSKVSIRALTPRVDIKGRIYYFSSDANRRLFLSNPETFLKGSFSHL